MIRRIRAKLVRSSLPARAIRLSSSAAATCAHHGDGGDHNQHRHHEPYGMEYGAGPSRFPYQPPARYQAANRPSNTSSANTTISARHSTDLSPYRTVKRLRLYLLDVKDGTYAQPNVFLNSIFKQGDIWSKPKIDQGFSVIRENLSSMTRLELHTLIHHLIRKKKGNLAAAILWEALSVTPRHRRRRLFAQKTISTLFRDRSIFYWPKVDSYSKARQKRNVQPSLEEQVSPPPSRDLQILLNILETMQDVRSQRPAILYEVIIRQSVAENQFDLAAKIYVGLVEEWVTEGRVAHGADPDNFHPGGGPPRAEAEEGRVKMSELLAHWWTGVRTWRFPGEVLSPHDRLDLWHPKHLSLGEKMKNFPLPLATSPPTMVPQPRSPLLATILNSLRLDPKKASPAEFASSMRALSILANTVLSRTLPIFGLGRLLQVFKSAPHKPDVYPDNITSIPTESAWAYTAYTQIQVTLMSLLFAPPISSHSMMMIAANQDAENDLNSEAAATDQIVPPVAVSQYMLPPLSWKSCTVLLQYAFSGLQRPQLLTKLLTYMKQVFDMGGEDPKVYNEVLRGASKLRDNPLAVQADVQLFGPTQQVGQDRPSHAPSVDKRPDLREVAASARASEGSFELSGIQLPTVAEGQLSRPDQESIINLIIHLTVTSQFKRLEEFIYRLEPYLDFSKSQPVEEVSSRMDAKGIEAGFSGRPRSEPMTPWMYVAILRGLEKAGYTGLAQRIYNIALLNERRLAEQSVLSDQSAHDENGRPPVHKQKVSLEVLPPGSRLPLEFFIVMMDVWANEGRAARRSIDKGFFEVERPIGWQVKVSGTSRPSAVYSPTSPSASRDTPKNGNLPRAVAAGLMAVELHGTVKSRFAPRELTLKYFKAYIRACRWRWKLSEDKPMFNGFIPEVADLIDDMEEAGRASKIPNCLFDKLYRTKPPYTTTAGEEDDDEMDGPQTRVQAVRDGVSATVKDWRTEERRLYERIMGEEGHQLVEQFMTAEGADGMYSQEADVALSGDGDKEHGKAT
ncbi:hypothetical protein I316_00976 [Kwoniella heveanensis BCC8398]|uniref:Uncharacterized protein n=1 Tax=Kwoniella heveanensis BCC8398 TaxID=1296120 RepID=A0A1B9H1C0_9TREE|nr:hypothetical protein I316_00976 [Kwoniella heveanensis BCC8398]